ncbi:MAG: penicillin-insensitive murein endopeptidase [Kofleriaceae bacterium]|nr:penicillin-insensitive murein endopeptidase [Kofleriaceae bacterium]MBP6839588.1 penicillin-insensitive murein endopeptidase [Kofleriaceae bacterium]MBP9205689.1 penicillin-insensitive murein endopeptidase [Kofleriaceae bacterium]
MRRQLLLLLVLVGTVAATSTPAQARRRHVVQGGETLVHIARAYGCSVQQLQRANRLDTTLIRSGTRLDIPACKLKPAPQGRRRLAAVAPRRGGAAAATSRPGRVRGAMAALDRADAGGPLTLEDLVVRAESPREVAASLLGRSVGRPWGGRLRQAIQLPPGEGYLVRRPHRAWGCVHVVEQLSAVLAEVRATYPDAHTLAIGDLSAETGGRITEHRSHQSGRDVDVGFFFTKVPEAYPASFVVAGPELDLERTWGLLMAFVRTRGQPGGVTAIFLDHGVQQRLHDWALASGVPAALVDDLFQYPDSKQANVGLVRHEPHHDDHFHIRFGCAPDDPGCE